METSDYLRILVEDIHSAIIATIGDDGRPVTRAIDLMLWDDRGVYFLTARGKAFFDQITAQGFVALTAVKDKRAVSLRGWVENIGSEKREEIFEKNPYMQLIYPEGTRDVLDVFRLYKAEGSYFDISDPSRVYRDTVSIGGARTNHGGYSIGYACIGCGRCAHVCPQDCIDVSDVPAVIDQHRCLHCGQCVDACPVGAITRL